LEIKRINLADITQTFAKGVEYALPVAFPHIKCHLAREFHSQPQFLRARPWFSDKCAWFAFNPKITTVVQPR